MKTLNDSEIQEWQNKIISNFSGPSGIVGEKLLALTEIENQITEQLIGTFHGYVRLMDAFFDFYIDSLQNLTSIKKWTENRAILTVIHVPTFWRFRSSYLLFWKGYFIDATSLLRAVLENVFNIAALNHNIITIDDIIGHIKVDNKSNNLSYEEIIRLINQHSKTCDNKVISFLMGKESGLSDSSIKHLKSLRRTLHNSVHKSKLTISQIYSPFIRGEYPLSIFPKIDEESSSMYMNISQFIGWITLKTFPLLQSSENKFPLKWQEKYKVLDESFEKAIGEFTQPLGRAVEELVEKKYKFTI